MAPSPAGGAYLYGGAALPAMAHEKPWWRIQYPQCTDPDTQKGRSGCSAGPMGGAAGAQAMGPSDLGV